MAMSVEDMAEELAIGRSIAYQLIQQPDFPSFMIGRRVLVSRKGLPGNGSTGSARKRGPETLREQPVDTEPKPLKNIVCSPCHITDMVR